MIRNITIRPVLNGFVCQVGCQEVLAANTAVLAAEIKRYYDNPEVVEQEYQKNAINKMRPIVPLTSPCNDGATAGLRLTANERCNEAIPEAQCGRDYAVANSPLH